MTDTREEQEMKLSLDIDSGILNEDVLKDMVAKCEANGGQATLEITVRLQTDTKFVRVRKPLRVFEI